MGVAGKESYQLASYRRCAERISVAWPAFLAAHADRLRHGNEAEKVAEAIIEDLLTQVLDWDKGDLMYQVGYADIVVSRNLVKYLIIEVKRPGTLLPGRKALDDAVAQARRYAGEQKVRCVAATDGRFLYAADVSGGGLADRVLVDLTMPEPPLGLWWLSVHGVYRACDEPAIYAQFSRPLQMPQWLHRPRKFCFIRNISCPPDVSHTSRMRANQQPGNCRTFWKAAARITSACQKRSRQFSAIIAAPRCATFQRPIFLGSF